uniref:Uncharacterized protein n=1 Tax=Noccaea caerulescens TaxID=107243 RepID=A0A1J3I6V3_NOCCA
MDHREEEIQKKETNLRKKKQKENPVDHRCYSTHGGEDPDPDLSFGSGFVEVEFSEDVKSGDKADETETHNEDDGR